MRTALLPQAHDALVELEGFEGVRAVDGYPSEAFQESFDEAMAQFAARLQRAGERPRFDMLVLSSGGVNGSFGAGVLTAWAERGDRPEFSIVSGVSVGALMAPFVFAGESWDDRLTELFARLEPGDLHREKGMLASVLWDESLMDNGPLRRTIEENIDDKLVAAIAEQHAAGRRCWVGTTNLDAGQFVVWDLGAIASRGGDAAIAMIRDVVTASASIPVVYPPVRFQHAEGDELHADGAVIRPLFLPQNVFDGYLSADRAGISWDNIDATMWVVHNGSLRPCPTTVERDTLGIATRTVTMMSYTMVAEHVLHLYMLSRAWAAEFRFVTLPDGLDLAVDAFTADDTERLYMLGRGLIDRDQAWLRSPPGYLVSEDLDRVVVLQPSNASTGPARRNELDELRALASELQQRLEALAGQSASTQGDPR